MDTFCVGYARVDFTPDESVPLRGYGLSSERMSQTVLDRLYLTCLALTDEEGQRALIYAMDICSPGNICTERWRPAVSRATGIPVERIMVSGSHTHSGPALNNFDEPSIDRLKARLDELFVQVAHEALADSKPATAACTKIETRNLTFVRRFVKEDGSFAGANYGSVATGRIKCPESKADSMLRCSNSGARAERTS